MKTKIQLVCLTFFVLASFGSVDAEEPSKAEYDKLKASVQEICPVSGENLNRMGGPVKVKVGQEELFLCCKGCASQKINKQHWITIHNNFAKAQRICPVMEHELPESPKWTFVDGQIVYICCPPCTKQLKANPKKYLAKLAGYYESALKRPIRAASNGSPGLR